MSTDAKRSNGPPYLWGKLKFSAAGVVEDWLSLADHCTDVAAVFRALVELPGPSRALARAIGVRPTTVQLDRLAVLAFLHDIGKCNRGFQAKAYPDARRTAGHVGELAVFFHDRDLQEHFLQALSFDALAGWFDEPEGALRLLLASISHHGKPVVLNGVDAHLLRPLWRADASRDPLADVTQLVLAARRMFPPAFDVEAPPLLSGPALQHRFAGLVMLADWIGSHREAFFPFNHGAGDRVTFARRQASVALGAVGLDVSGTRPRSDSPSASFERLFDFAPTPMQTVLFEEADSPVLILESETGSGKTEAALSYFYRLFAQGDVDALYFALPTRVAARALYERVLAFARRAFGKGHLPVLLAVPGYAMVDGEPPDHLPAPEHLWQDDAQMRRRERSWAAERPKRYLAAPIAVGTVDQALLSVMQANHAHLRAVCLERSLLVVDEVHASDTYMRGLLRTLLARHRAAGGRALLLSATLGSGAQAELLTSPASHHRTPPLDEAARRPYPALTDAAGGSIPLPRSIWARHKQVHIEPAPWLTRPESVLPEVTAALAGGARVLVVLNTVARVTGLLRAAEQIEDIRPALFQCAGIVCPHHGRFARPDRLLLDGTVSATLGRQSPQAPVLLIGSQTLEQSLDIDADWLITDLAPMDVLLQRIGRLHRHDRVRPAGFEQPRCTVLLPEDPTLESLFDSHGQVRPQAGLGRVYADLRMCRLTRESIGAGVTVTIPEDNRRLVEACTHPENLESFRTGPWERHRNELLGVSMAHGDAARRTLFAADAAFGDDSLRFRALDERIATRLGLDDRRLALPSPMTSPFGQELHELALPGWMARGIDADALDNAPAIDAEGISFHYGGRSFRYTRYGLEHVQS